MNNQANVNNENGNAKTLNAFEQLVEDVNEMLNNKQENNTEYNIEKTDQHFCQEGEPEISNNTNTPSETQTAIENGEKETLFPSSYTNFLPLEVSTVQSPSCTTSNASNSVMVATSDSTLHTVTPVESNTMVNNTGSMDMDVRMNVTSRKRGRKKIEILSLPVDVAQEVTTPVNITNTALNTVVVLEPSGDSTNTDNHGDIPSDATTTSTRTNEKEQMTIPLEDKEEGQNSETKKQEDDNEGGPIKKKVKLEKEDEGHETTSMTETSEAQEETPLSTSLSQEETSSAKSKKKVGRKGKKTQKELQDLIQSAMYMSKDTSARQRSLADVNHPSEVSKNSEEIETFATAAEAVEEKKVSVKQEQAEDPDGNHPQQESDKGGHPAKSSPKDTDKSTTTVGRRRYSRHLGTREENKDDEDANDKNNKRKNKKDDSDSDEDSEGEGGNDHSSHLITAEDITDEREVYDESTKNHLSALRYSLLSLFPSELRSQYRSFYASRDAHISDEQPTDKLKSVGNGMTGAKHDEGEADISKSTTLPSMEANKEANAVVNTLPPVQQHSETSRNTSSPPPQIQPNEDRLTPQQLFKEGEALWQLLGQLAEDAVYVHGAWQRYEGNANVRRCVLEEARRRRHKRYSKNASLVLHTAKKKKKPPPTTTRVADGTILQGGVPTGAPGLLESVGGQVLLHSNATGHDLLLDGEGNVLNLPPCYIETTQEPYYIAQATDEPPLRRFSFALPYPTISPMVHPTAAATIKDAPIARAKESFRHSLPNSNENSNSNSTAFLSHGSTRRGSAAPHTHYPSTNSKSKPVSRRASRANSPEAFSITVVPPSSSDPPQVQQLLSSDLPRSEVEVLKEISLPTEVLLSRSQQALYQRHTLSSGRLRHECPEIFQTLTRHTKELRQSLLDETFTFSSSNTENQ